jgi:hypothetical protein
LILLSLNCFCRWSALTFLYNGRGGEMPRQPVMTGLAADNGLGVRLQQNATIPYALLQNAEHGYRRLLLYLRYSLSGRFKPPVASLRRLAVQAHCLRRRAWPRPV